MRLLFAILIAGLSIRGYCQAHLGVPVTLHAERITLQDLLDALQSQSGVVMVYGADNIPVDFVLDVDVSDAPLFEVLDQICDTVGLTYRVIEDIVAFREDPTPMVDEDILSHAAARVNSRLLERPRGSMTLLHGVRRLEDDIGRIPLRIRRREIITAVQSKTGVEPGVALKNRVGRRPSGVFLHYDYGLGAPAFLETDLDFQYYQVESNLSAGLGAFVAVSPRVYLALGVGYAARDFSLTHNYDFMDTGDPFPVPDKTLVDLRHVGTPVSVAYELYRRERYSVLVTGGVSPHFLVGDGERTTYRNQLAQSTDFLRRHSTKMLYSGDAGVVVYRKLGRYFGVFLFPGYVYSPRAANEKCMKAGTGVWRVRGGVVIVGSRQ